MHSRHYTWHYLFMRVLISNIVILIFLQIFAVSQAWAVTTPAPDAKDIEVLTSALPAQAHLVIASIHVNAPIESVETNTDGTLQVPAMRPWDGVGWYADGPYPGELGSAVIDGHLDRPGGYPAVFWDLRLLHVGDIVQVVAPRQATVRFRVTEVASYVPSQAPLSRIFSDAKGTFLNLITCSGRWIPAIHQTTRRLVVYTKMI